MEEDNINKALEIHLQRANNPEAQARKKADQVIQALKLFSRGIYNRDNMMERRFRNAILSDQPIQIIGFWGVGEKRLPDILDDLLLDEYRIVKKLLGMITLKEAEVILILADIHGIFNGYENTGYHTMIEQKAKEEGFMPIYLSKLYEEWGIGLPNLGRHIDDSLWLEFMKLKQSSQLIESARRHNRANIEPEKAAFWYWLMRRQEAEPLTRSFPNDVLFINGSRDLGMATLPLDMPHVYSRLGPVWFL